MMRVGEVARRLDVSAKTVYRLIATGSLGAHRIGGEYRVSEPQLHAYLESTVVGGPAPAAWATPPPPPAWAPAFRHRRGRRAAPAPGGPPRP